MQICIWNLPISNVFSSITLEVDWSLDYLFHGLAQMGLFIKGSLSLPLQKKEKNKEIIYLQSLKMAGNLGKKDSSSVQDLQDPSTTGKSNNCGYC